MWWNGLRLDPKEKTIGNVLRSNGYDTGYFGKMHVDGIGSHTSIARHFGFDESFLYEDWCNLLTTDHVEMTGVKSQPNRIRDEFFAIMAKSWVGKLSTRRLQHEDVVADRAIEFIKKWRNKPYFCVVGFHGPHPPYAAPPPFDTMYDPASLSVPSKMRKTDFGFQMTPESWQELKSQYFGMVSWIDDNIGRILKHVDSNTIVIFTSDHGDILGDHGYFSKGLYAYEGNIRVPLMIRFPGRPATEYTHIVQAVDLVPTVLGALEVKRLAGMQGHNLYPHIWDNQKVNPWAFSCIGLNRRLRMIRTAKFKYWWYDNEVLFDLEGDPSESKNIASTHKDLLHEMRRLMIKVLIETEDPTPLPSR